MHRCNLKCKQVPFLLLFLAHSHCPHHLWDCKVSCIVNTFLIFFSTHGSSPLVHFKNGTEYILRGRQPRYLSLRWNFCYVVWFPVVFLVSWGILFYIFFNLHMFDGVCFQYSQVFVSVFSTSVLIFSWLGSSIPSDICHLPLFIISLAHFSLPNYIPLYCLFIFTVCISVSHVFFIFLKQLHMIYVHDVVGIIIIIIIIIIISLLPSFFYAQTGLCILSLGADFEFSKFSMGVFSILTVLNKDVVCMVSILHFISNRSSHLSKFVGPITSTSTTIGIMVSLM